MLFKPNSPDADHPTSARSPLAEAGELRLAGVFLKPTRFELYRNWLRYPPDAALIATYKALGPSPDDPIPELPLVRPVHTARISPRAVRTTGPQARSASRTTPPLKFGDLASPTRPHPGTTGRILFVCGAGPAAVRGCSPHRTAPVDRTAADTGWRSGLQTGAHD